MFLSVSMHALLSKFCAIECKEKLDLNEDIKTFASPSLKKQSKAVFGIVHHSSTYELLQSYSFSSFFFNLMNFPWQSFFILFFRVFTCKILEIPLIMETNIELIPLKYN